MSAIQSPVVFLLAMNILLLVVGMFMDIISATLILGPVFLPMLATFDVDMMHFGLIMTVNLAIGYCTPPMGVSLYITGRDGQQGPDLRDQGGAAVYRHSGFRTPGHDLSAATCPLVAAHHGVCAVRIV